MPVYLPAPQAAAPDGRGWNRLRIETPYGTGECALRPLTATKLFETWDTRRAAYGGFGPCPRRGDCDGCPVFARLSGPRPRLSALADQILFRIHPHHPGELWAMDHPERGWESWGYIWGFDELALVQGWDFDRLHHDEHGEGFWLRRVLDGGSGE